MIAKNYTPKRTICKVTFTMPADVVTEKVSLAGDFNDWDPSDYQLEKKGENYEIELRLKPESTYRFKYLIDDQFGKMIMRQMSIFLIIMAPRIRL